MNFTFLLSTPFLALIWVLLGLTGVYTAAVIFRPNGIIRKSDYAIATIGVFSGPVVWILIGIDLIKRNNCR